MVLLERTMKTEDTPCPNLLDHRGPSSTKDRPPSHDTLLHTAIRNTLSTKLALETFAQVIDGLPIRKVAVQYHPDIPRGQQLEEFNLDSGSEADLGKLLYQFPIESSKEAKQYVKVFLDNLDYNALKLDPRLMQTYQNAPLDTPQFALQLIESIVVACHHTGATLSTAVGGGIYKDSLSELWETKSSWEQPSGDTVHTPSEENISENEWNFTRAPKVKHLTELFHPSYRFWEQYPKDVEDTVGYWVELQLFGGVILFDRGASGEGSNDLFFEPVRTENIYQVSPAQVEKFMSFALSDTPQPNPVRFHTERNLRKYDWYNAIAYHNIYRDRHEKVIPQVRPRMCVRMMDEEDAELYQEQMKKWLEARNEATIVRILPQ